MLRRHKIFLFIFIVTFFLITEISSNTVKGVTKESDKEEREKMKRQDAAAPLMDNEEPMMLNAGMVDPAKAATLTLPYDDIVKHITGVPTIKPTDSHAVLFNLPVPGAAVEEHLINRTNNLVASKSFIALGFIILMLYQIFG